MKAVMVTRYGGPEVLTYQEAPEPTPGPGEVLIRTEVVSVNFADIKARRGTDSVTTPLPFIPGHEVVGTVEAIGEQVHTLRVGQRVTAVVTSGAYAELVVAPAVFTFLLPDTLASEAAAGLVVLMTAFNVLTLAGRISQGELQIGWYTHERLLLSYSPLCQAEFTGLWNSSLTDHQAPWKS